MPEDAEIHDPLDDSPILEEVLGEALPRLRKFHVKLSTEGEPRGLIGPRDVGILWERHILNSAAIVPFIRREIGKTSASIADVGSGGGFPGIVAAACMPEHRFTLIEPMERRVEWLHECVELMGLSNVTVIRARAEEIIAALKRRDAQVRPFDAVTCRAVAPMTKLTGWTLPMLKPQGSLIALKGRSAQWNWTRPSVLFVPQGVCAHAWLWPRSAVIWSRPTWLLCANDKRYPQLSTYVWIILWITFSLKYQRLSAIHVDLWNELSTLLMTLSTWLTKAVQCPCAQ